MGAFLLTFALKGTVVLAVGASAAAMARRASASLRHGVWAATFAVLLTLPVVGALGPSWRVAVLPSAAPEVALPVWTPESASRASAGGSAASPARPNDDVAVGAPGPVVTWLAWLWALGAFGVGSVWLRGFVLGRRLVWASRVVDDERWSARVRAAERAVDPRRPVCLRLSDDLSVPVAWGWGRPTVVLPAQAGTWDAERVRSVLLHEVAHLRRRDAWTQAVAQAALAVHWPNPLAWVAYRRFLAAREQACDDAVLGAGARPTAYASHLVAAARDLSPSRLALAAASPLVGPDELEARVRAVLDGQRRRGPVGRWTTSAALALAVSVAVPLAAFQPVAHRASAQTHRKAGERSDGVGTLTAVPENVGGRRGAPPRADGGARRDTTDSLRARPSVREAAVVQGQAADAVRAVVPSERGVRDAQRAVHDGQRRVHEAQRHVEGVERAAAEARQEADEIAREEIRLNRTAADLAREAARIEQVARDLEGEAARLRRVARQLSDSTRSGPE